MVVQIITFVSALGLVRELARVTGRKWLAASFLLIVAICRPSIFWSLKLSTEPVCEAFLYATAAAALAALRTRAWYWAVLCGFLALCLGLNRPGFLPGTMLIPFAFLVYGLQTRLRETRTQRGASAASSRWMLAKALVPERRAFLITAVFALGFFGPWSVWIGRNVINYGAFIPTSSSAAQSSIWDYGGSPIKIGRYNSLTLADGSTFTKFGQVMEEANSYAKDYDGAKRLFMIAQAWHKANWMDLPRAFLWRLKHIVAIRGASGLTTVPREYLFVTLTPQYNNPYTPTAWLDLLLLDKTPFICFIALGGLTLFAWNYPKSGLVFIGLAFVPWMASAAVIGYERTVESLIAMTIWFALFGIVNAASWLNARESALPGG